MAQTKTLLNTIEAEVKPLTLSSKPGTWRDVVWHDDPIMQEFFENGVNVDCDKVTHESDGV